MRRRDWPSSSWQAAVAAVMLAGTCWTTPAAAQWPSPKGWQDAYDFVQARRADAEKLWKQKDPAGVELLLKTLPYLDEPLVRDLAAGNQYLAARRLNIFMDLAQAYAIRGETDACLEYLRKVPGELRSPGLAAFYEHDPAFAALRDHPEFKRIVAELRLFESFWDSPALKTAYAANLSDAEKIAGLSRLWSEVKFNFGYPETLVALDWDRLYLESIPRVLATTSTTDYYRELMRLCARLGDGHTNVYAPPETDIGAKPPLRTGLVGGRVLVLEVRSRAVEAKGIHAGMEIVVVDGVPAADYARRDIEPFVSAATPQDRDVRTYGYGFLRGPATKPVRMTLRDAKGAASEVVLERSGYTDVVTPPPFAWRLLEGNVAYVALNSFESGQIVTQWRQALPEIAKATAIVLDVRLNGGGSSNVGWEILKDLTVKPFLSSAQRLRRYNPTDRARGSLVDFTSLPAETIEPRPNAYATRPVVVLAGPATYSAAEDFLVAWKSSRRGAIVGEPTGGSTGQPLTFALPGGGSARVCTKKDTFPDQVEWVGKGIAPDVLVRPTLAGVQAGTDEVLDRALALLAAPMSP